MSAGLAFGIHKSVDNRGIMIHDSNKDGPEDMTSRLFETSNQDLYAEKIASVAERSMLSQNFVHGTEDSIETVPGVAKEVI